MQKGSSRQKHQPQVVAYNKIKDKNAAYVQTKHYASFFSSQLFHFIFEKFIYNHREFKQN